MRHAEMGGGLRKTAVLHDREEDVQVPQPQASADVAVPVDNLGHKQALSAMKEK